MTKAFTTAFKITSWFECGDNPFTLAAGNFDGQGLSFGPRQTNIGCGTLQPLLKRFIRENEALAKSVFGNTLFPKLRDMLGMPNSSDQVQWCIRNLNTPQRRLLPEWKTAFESLGRQPAMQNIFMDDAASILPQVQELTTWIALGGRGTTRVFCLAYDIITQNGNISKSLRLLLTMMRPLLLPFKRTDKDWMRFVAWMRSMWTDFRGNEEFSQDVLSRKLTIVRGRSKFRGELIDLGEKFGLNDEPL